jgi:ribosome-associated protein
MESERRFLAYHHKPKESELPQGVEDLKEEFFRSGGKGGQNVNKRESGVRLRVKITDPELLAKLREEFPDYLNAEGELLVKATERKEREENRKLARNRLEEILAAARKEEKERLPTERTPSSEKRRLEEKRRRGETKRLRERIREW